MDFFSVSFGVVDYTDSSVSMTEMSNTDEGHMTNEAI